MSTPIRIRKDLDQVIIALSEYSDIEYKDVVAYLISEGLESLRIKLGVDKLGEVVNG